MRQLKDATALTMFEAEGILAEIAKDLNKMVGLLLVGENVSVAAPMMLSICQAAQFAEQAVVQIRQGLQNQQAQNRIQVPQMVPGPMRRN